MQHRDWILKAAVIGPRHRFRDDNDGPLTAEQRGYVYRLFAFCGGALALDAVIQGIGSAALPQRAKDVVVWFDNELDQLVRTRAAAAAAVLPLNQRNALQMIKLALRNAARANKKPAKTSRYNQREWSKDVYETLTRYPGLPGGVA